MDNLLGFIAGAAFAAAARIGYGYYRKTWGTGSPRAYIRDGEEPPGAYRIVRKLKTATQKIALVESGDETWVYCNGELMFSTTEDEDQYAETFVHIPMSAAERPRSVLVIGGGGGVTTREVLKYAEVESVTVVDVDEEIMDFGKNLEALVKFNRGALNDPRVETVVADGRQFAERSSRKWDVILVDVPEPSDRCPGLSRLFSVEFYRLLKDRLNPGGAIGVACSASSLMPDYFAGVQATMRAAGFVVLPYHLDFVVESGEDWGFSLGTLRRIEAGKLRIGVPVRHLNPARLRDVLHMPYYFAEAQSRGRVQTDINDVLLRIVREAD